MIGIYYTEFAVQALICLGSRKREMTGYSYDVTRVQPKFSVV